MTHADSSQTTSIGKPRSWGLCRVIVLAITACAAQWTKAEDAAPRLPLQAPSPTDGPLPRKEDLIAHALHTLGRPHTVEQEMDAVRMLFGEALIRIERGDLPTAVQARLMARGIKYRSPEARTTSLQALGDWFADDVAVPAMLGLVHEGLNDPHADVRGQAAQVLYAAILASTRPIRLPRDKAALAEYYRRRGEHAEQLIDLAIHKGLTDDDPLVRGTCMTVLESELVTPTWSSLRSLDRALAKKRQLHRNARPFASELRTAWQKRLDAESAIPKPAESTKPAERVKPAEDAKPAEAVKLAEPAKPTQRVKPAEPAKSAIHGARTSPE